MPEHNDAHGAAGSPIPAPPTSSGPGPAEASVGTNPRDLGKRLQHARKQSKKTQQDAAEFLGVARTTITAMEKGERRVRPDELARLAAFYGARVNELLRHGEPDEEFAVQLRAAVAPHETLAQDLEAATYEFQQLCEDYVELERLVDAPLPRHYPAEVPLPTTDVEQRAEGLANAERNRLGLGDGPVMNVRELLEQDVGLRVFYLPMPSKVAAMFAYTDRLGGCIAVNWKHPEVRRRQSAVHEYAHFLTTRHRGEVAIQNRFERTPTHERFANAFARSFLMSASGLTRRYAELKQSKPAVTVADLCTLAHYYYVSVESLTRRLEELRLLSMGTWDRLQQKQFRVREAQQLLGLVEREVRDDLLPARYTFLALHCYREGALSEGRLARFLRVDRAEARRVVWDVTHGAQASESDAASGMVLRLQTDRGIPGGRPAGSEQGQNDDGGANA